MSCQGIFACLPDGSNFNISAIPPEIFPRGSHLLLFCYVYCTMVIYFSFRKKNEILSSLLWVLCLLDWIFLWFNHLPTGYLYLLILFPSFFHAKWGKDDILDQETWTVLRQSEDSVVLHRACSGFGWAPEIMGRNKSLQPLLMPAHTWPLFPNSQLLQNNADDTTWRRKEKRELQRLCQENSRLTL